MNATSSRSSQPKNITLSLTAATKLEEITNAALKLVFSKEGKACPHPSYPEARIWKTSARMRFDTESISVLYRKASRTDPEFELEIRVKPRVSDEIELFRIISRDGIHITELLKFEQYPFYPLWWSEYLVEAAARNSLTRLSRKVPPRSGT